MFFKNSGAFFFFQFGRGQKKNQHFDFNRKKKKNTEYTILTTKHSAFHVIVSDHHHLFRHVYDCCARTTPQRWYVIV